MSATKLWSNVKDLPSARTGMQEDCKKGLGWMCSGLVLALDLWTYTFRHHQQAVGDGHSPDSTEDEEACGAALTLALSLQLCYLHRWPNFDHPLIMITVGQVVV